MGKLNKQVRNYTQAPNDIINHPELSLKAKGLWLFINSKPDGWSFSKERIATQAKDGKESIKNGLQELESFGLLKRTQSYNHETKKFDGYDYTLFDIIQTSPADLKPANVNLANTKPAEFSNKEISKKDIVKKIEREAPTKIELLKSNPLFEKNRGVFFNNLTDDEIDLLAETFLQDYPKSSDTTIFQFLKEQSQKKATDAAIKAKISKPKGFSSSDNGEKRVEICAYEYDTKQAYDQAILQNPGARVYEPTFSDKDRWAENDSRPEIAKNFKPKSIN